VAPDECEAIIHIYRRSWRIAIVGEEVDWGVRLAKRLVHCCRIAAYTWTKFTRLLTNHYDITYVTQ